MNDMTSFKNVLIMNINGKRFTRDYYIQVIATWYLNSWLTETEVTECITALNTAYPSTDPISFKATIVTSIEAKKLTRTKYEEIIAACLLNSWLTEQDGTDCMTALNVAFPVTE